MLYHPYTWIPTTLTRASKYICWQHNTLMIKWLPRHRQLPHLPPLQLEEHEGGVSCRIRCLTGAKAVLRFVGWEGQCAVATRFLARSGAGRCEEARERLLWARRGLGWWHRFLYPVDDGGGAARRRDLREKRGSSRTSVAPPLGTAAAACVGDEATIVMGAGLGILPPASSGCQEDGHDGWLCGGPFSRSGPRDEDECTCWPTTTLCSWEHCLFSCS